MGQFYSHHEFDDMRLYSGVDIADLIFEMLIMLSMAGCGIDVLRKSKNQFIRTFLIFVSVSFYLTYPILLYVDVNSILSFSFLCISGLTCGVACLTDAKMRGERIFLHFEKKL